MRCISNFPKLPLLRGCELILKMTNPLAVSIFLLVMIVTLFAQPVAIYRDNPHYFFYKGKPLIFVTSDQHYGAVIDRDFDFEMYLDYLHENGMNLTRIYPGGMFEPPDKYIVGNPLGPLPGRQILPWAKSLETGASPLLAEPGQPSYKFDLDHWNPEYFERLKAFVDYANEKNIIVEIAFFNGMYADCWPLMAMYFENNIQKMGHYEADSCGLFTTADPRNAEVIRYQQAYVAKITSELNEFDNLIFDLCDEPSLTSRMDGTIIVMPDSLIAPWLLKMRDAFLDAEKDLPKKHILGQTIQNLSPDFAREEWCDWLPCEYVKPAQAAIDANYSANKPMVVVESDYFGVGLTPSYSAVDVRLEGWWFILQGGAGVINLNGEYCHCRERGGEKTQHIIVPQKKILYDFITSFNVQGLSRFTDFSGLPEGAIASALAEPGKQYALYLFHANHDSQWGAHFVHQPGAYEESVTLHKVPVGDYLLEWIDPATGSKIRSEVAHSNGTELVLHTPPYSIDVACRMVVQ